MASGGRRARTRTRCLRNKLVMWIITNKPVFGVQIVQLRGARDSAVLRQFGEVCGILKGELGSLVQSIFEEGFDAVKLHG